MEIMAGILISTVYAGLTVGAVWAVANRLERKQIRCSRPQTFYQSDVASGYTGGTPALRPAGE